MSADCAIARTREHALFMGMGMVEWLKWRSKLAVPARAAMGGAAGARDELVVLLTNMKEASPRNGN